MCFLILRNFYKDGIGKSDGVNVNNAGIIKSNDEKIKNVLGLARKAGALSAGTELVIDSARKKRAFHIFACSDASAGTLKKLRDKAAFYQIPLTELNLTMSELAQCVGLLRPTAAVSITNKSFLALTEKCLKDSDEKT